MISVNDPDARHTRKSPEARRDGYRAHVAADPETGIITDEKLTGASGTGNSDPAVAEEFLAAETADDDGDRTDGEHADRGAAFSQDSGDDRLAWYGDSAYGTGDLRGAICDAGHDAVIKPKPLQAPVTGGFTVDDFTVDGQARHGHLPGRTGRAAQPHPHRHLRRGLPRLPAARAVHDLQDRPQARPARTRRNLLRAARADWAARHRAARGLHGSPAQRRAHRRPGRHLPGRRLELRYLGVAKNHAWLKRRTAALNLRDLLGKGLTRRDGASVLAT